MTGANQFKLSNSSPMHQYFKALLCNREFLFIEPVGAGSKKIPIHLPQDRARYLRAAFTS
jgi:hypothetical protein